MFHLITDFAKKMDDPDRKDTREYVNSHDLHAHSAHAQTEEQVYALNVSEDKAIIS